MTIPNQDPNKSTYDKNGTYRNPVSEAPFEQTLPIMPQPAAPKPFTLTGGGDGSRR